jgi:hypothetical protein
MKINKKILSLGCATLSISLIGITVLASLALSHSENKTNSNNSNPSSCHYGCEHADISYFVDRTYFAKKCLTTNDHLFIDEQKFRENIGDILRHALKKVNQFANNSENYSIELNYQFVAEKAVNLDVL